MITKKMIYALSIVLLTSGMFAAQQLPKTATGFNKGLSLAQKAIQEGDFNEARAYITQLKKINPRSSEISRLEAALSQGQAGQVAKRRGEELAESDAKFQEKLHELEQEKENFEKFKEDALEYINRIHDERQAVTQERDAFYAEINKKTAENLDLQTKLDAQTAALTDAEKELKATKEKIDKLTQSNANITRFINAFTKPFFDVELANDPRILPEGFKTIDQIINGQLLVNQTFKLMWDKAINNSLKRNWLNVAQEGLGIKLKGLIASKVLSSVSEE